MLKREMTPSALGRSDLHSAQLTKFSHVISRKTHFQTRESSPLMAGLSVTKVFLRSPY